MTVLSANKFVFYILICSIFFTIFTNIPSYLHDDFATTLIIQDLLLLGLPILIYFILTKQKYKVVIPHNKLDFKNIVLIIGMSIFIAPLVELISNITLVFVDTSAIESFTPTVESPFILSFIAFVITPPILEELAYRGIFFSNYTNHSLKTVATMSGLFFGFIHLNFSQFAYAFFLGYIFCYFVYYTKSIYASIIAHMVINFISVTSFYLYEDISDTTAVATSDIWVVLYGALYAIIPTLIFYLLYKTFVKHNLAKYPEIISNKTVSEIPLETSTVNFSDTKNIQSKDKLLDFYSISTIILSLIIMFYFG